MPFICANPPGEAIFHCWNGYSGAYSNTIVCRSDVEKCFSIKKGVFQRNPLLASISNTIFIL
jgi:hypothetical protein